MAPGPSIAVIVCAHTAERLANIRDALRSLEVQSRPPAEIILIVDHNPELMATIRAEFPSVTVKPNSGAKGLSGARNTGVQSASADIVAFLDDDAGAAPDWLERLAAAYADADTMAVGGHVEPVWPQRRPRWFPREFDWVVGCSYLGLPTAPGPVRNLIGCNMSARREIIDAVGGFREGQGRDGDNGSGCEETELFIRARAGFPDRNVVYDPGARVSHAVAPGRTRWRYFVARCLAEGRSKADMVGAVGAEDGLSAEETYTRKTLPSGVLRGLTDTLRGDVFGLGRAAAILAGFALVAGVYGAGRLRARRTSVATPFRPWAIIDADLSSPLPALPDRHAGTGVPYGGAFCLARRDGRPFRIVEIDRNRDCDAWSANGFARRLRTDPAPLPSPALADASGDDAPSVTVVIATRDRAESLARCLDSLATQTYSNFDIVVVDNAPSSDATERLIADRYAPAGNIHYVREARPGLGRAHNSGLAIARGDIVAFTDDDVIVDAGWVQAIANNFAHDPEIGCVTGLILPAELETRAQLWTERHGGFGKGMVRRVYDTNDNRPDDPLFPYAAGGFGSGANMAFRRSALERIGGFDAALGAGTPAKGGDDLAGFLSVVQAGYRLAYEPSALVWHHHRRAEEGMVRQAYGYGVGLGAYLTRQLVEQPSLALVFARRLPAAVAHLFSRSSPKLARLPSDYPRRLVWRERFGVLMGVPLYLKSRRVNRDAPPSSPQRPALPVRRGA